MDSEEIATARAIIAAATPGPWPREPEWTQGFYVYTCMAVGPKGVTSDKDFKDPIFDQPRHDAQFIAAARTGWPKALDELEGLQYRYDHYRNHAAPLIEQLRAESKAIQGNDPRFIELKWLRAVADAAEKVIIDKSGDWDSFSPGTIPGLETALKAWKEGK